MTARACAARPSAASTAASGWLDQRYADEASDLTRDDVRQLVYGMPYSEWKAKQPEVTPEQVGRSRRSAFSPD